jgi:hypothetical protein
MHGWRQFAGEVGIIVLGVLIALGAEQLAEAIHWSRQTQETERVLLAEIQVSTDTAAERFTVDGCLRTELALLRAAVPNGLAKAPVTIASAESRVVPDLYASPWRAWTRGRWEAALASNALNHVDSARLGDYAETYKAIEDIDGLVRRERETKGGLAPLSLGHLAPAEAAQVVIALTNLDRDRADILIAGRDLLKESTKLGIQPRPAMVRFLSSRYATCN